MTRPKTAVEIGVPCWKVRVVFGTATLHVLSSTEPELVQAEDGSLVGVVWEPILDTEHGDTPGFIRWADVSAVTWRRA